MSCIEFIAALLAPWQFVIVIELRIAIDLLFRWFHSDVGKLFEGISQDQHISGKLTMDGGEEMVGRSV